MFFKHFVQVAADHHASAWGYVLQQWSHMATRWWANHTEWLPTLLQVAALRDDLENVAAAHVYATSPAPASVPSGLVLATSTASASAAAPLQALADDPCAAPYDASLRTPPAATEESTPWVAEASVADLAKACPAPVPRPAPEPASSGAMLVAAADQPETKVRRMWRRRALPFAPTNLGEVPVTSGDDSLGSEPAAGMPMVYVYTCIFVRFSLIR